MLYYEKNNIKNKVKIKRGNLADTKVTINMNNWQLMTNANQNIIELNATDEEYITTEKVFNDTGATGFVKKVLSIHRIQNRRHYVNICRINKSLKRGTLLSKTTS